VTAGLGLETSRLGLESLGLGLEFTSVENKIRSGISFSLTWIKAGLVYTQQNKLKSLQDETSSYSMQLKQRLSSYPINVGLLA
jgi:hypothetical protein